MKRFRVFIPKNVQDQITAQVLYIAADSIDNALAWEERLRRAIAALGDGPGFAIDEEASARLNFAVRRLVFEGTYLIHFVVEEARAEVRVVNFRHGTRLPKRDEP